jgi:hypothetical protein
MRSRLAAAAALAGSALAGRTAPAQSVLYRAEFVQAAPGRLVELIDFYQRQQPAYAAAGEQRPLMVRHSQGDQWDLLLLVPLGDAGYFSPDRAARRDRAWDASGRSRPELERKRQELVAWREELYVRGPAVEEASRAFAAAGLAHLEIFQALPGGYGDLRHERDMEDAFNRAAGRSPLLIFTRDPELGGAGWDLFTIDLYRDLMDYAQRSTVPPATADSAARQAGFGAAADIGPTLRRYIMKHHDTLGTVIH